MSKQAICAMIGACYFLVSGRIEATDAQVVRGQALVIGNQSYLQSPLRTPIADETEVGAALRQLGFVVTSVEDTNFAQLKATIDSFSATLSGSTKPVVIYYAGNAVQINGVNYLIPVDAAFTSLNSVSSNAVSINYIFDHAHAAPGAPLLLILDACRTNPFAENSPTEWTPGLAAPTNAPKNALVAFATDPGSVSADGVGKHSPYTRALLKFVRSPGLPVEELFKSIREDVISNTDGFQTPWENTSLTASFFLRDPVTVVGQLTNVDDDATVLVNGQQVMSWNIDHTVSKNITLHGGANAIVVQVYNQRSYTGGIPFVGGHEPEGWRYSFNLRTSEGENLVNLGDGEDRPVDNGPHHGKLFTVATFQLHVDEFADAVTIRNPDFHAWTH